jgi:hypothetical protein
MSFQAYLDTIKEKTGLGPDDFVALAAEKGLAGPGLKAGAVIDWLAADYGLGRGHAMAIVAVLKQTGGPQGDAGDKLAKLFSGAKADWRPVFDALLAETQKFGADVSVAPTGTYASLVRGAKKFGIVEPRTGHLDIGIKRKGVAPEGRFEAAGDWNAMVTHRVRVEKGALPDAEILAWLKAAYEAAS